MSLDDEIHAYVTHHDHATVQTLSDDLDRPGRVVLKTAKILVNEDRLEATDPVEDMGRDTHLYVDGQAPDPGDGDLRGRVLEQLEADGPLSCPDLARAVGADRRRVANILQTLLEHRRVRETPNQDRSGTVYAYRPLVDEDAETPSSEPELQDSEAEEGEAAVIVDPSTLSSPRVDVLRHLDEHEGYHTQGDLQEATDRSQAAVSKAVNALRDEDLVDRREHDGRSKYEYALAQPVEWTQEDPEPEHERIADGANGNPQPPPEPIVDDPAEPDHPSDSPFGPPPPEEDDGRHADQADETEERLRRLAREEAQRVVDTKWNQLLGEARIPPPDTSDEATSEFKAKVPETYHARLHSVKVLTGKPISEQVTEALTLYFTHLTREHEQESDDGPVDFHDLEEEATP